MILRNLEGKFYQIDEKELAGKEVPQDKVEGLPPSLPAPPEASGDVAGHEHHHHWYNWHNHQWHDHHWHNHHHH